MNLNTRRAALSGLLALSMLAAACGDDETTSSTDAPTATTTGAAAVEPAGDLSGEIAIDGSSTVAPLMKLAAEDFQTANAGV
ncbi:MAG: phosphate-binding protein, partial [Actinomycetota bacterium]|nr:phosphate-binding protein [Actinomycetota bacterium]